MQKSFDYLIKKEINDRIEQYKDDILSKNVDSYDEYKYALGKLHAMELFLIDYKEILGKVIKDE